MSKATNVLKNKSGLRLDIGSGAAKQDDTWVGMDIQVLPGVDVVHDWNKFPWPFPDNSVNVAKAFHVVEHVNPADGHFLRWMDEVWRILRPEAQIALIFPYGGTDGYWQDPTHCNGCNEATWWYFDPLHESRYYQFYKPKPWKIEQNSVDTFGIGQAVLSKRRLDKSYE